LQSPIDYANGVDDVSYLQTRNASKLKSI